jgi:hypothetical protein
VYLDLVAVSFNAVHLYYRHLRVHIDSSIIMLVQNLVYVKMSILRPGWFWIHGKPLKIINFQALPIFYNVEIYIDEDNMCIQQELVWDLKHF